MVPSDSGFIGIRLALR